MWRWSRVRRLSHWAGLMTLSKSVGEEGWGAGQLMCGGVDELFNECLQGWGDSGYKGR